MSSRVTFTILIDTNVFIPLEPTSPNDVEPGTELSAELTRLSNAANVRLFVHPASRRDIERDDDTERRSARLILFRKYPELPRPPDISDCLESILGEVEDGTNDWVDHTLLEAIRSDVVHYLVTEDQGIHRKARRVGLGERVATVNEAVEILRRLFDATPTPPPAVESCLAHELATDDPIFDSFRQDYVGFDDWMRKCKQEHRNSWRILSEGKYAAFTIIKPEDGAELNVPGKVLKVCSFKVSDRFRGKSYGELLLQAVFDYSRTNAYDWLYVTVFPHHEYLVTFLQDFGFIDTGRTTELGELILQKAATVPQDASELSALEYQIHYGPYEFKLDGVQKFIVPIQPTFSGRLFPAAPGQQSLFAGSEACGNSIRKAYLCNAVIRRLGPGDVVLFYRSQDMQAIQVVGVVEQTVVSDDPSVVAVAAGKRTVYSYGEIEMLCQNGEVLVILFRQARILESPISIREMTEEGVLEGPPQSIQTLNERHNQWIKARLN